MNKNASITPDEPLLQSVCFARMQLADLQEVLNIEREVYPYPWSHGNFTDALRCGYEAWVVRDTSLRLIGYFLMLMAVDEAHLLNLAVRRDRQKQGLGRLLLARAHELARELKATSVLLEVRPSNERAIAVYIISGYKHIGRRKGYYPAANNVREDAIVMRCDLWL